MSDAIAETYSKLRQMVLDLREFSYCQQDDVAERIGWNPASLSRFVNGQQEFIPYHCGVALTELYKDHDATIRQHKISKANQLLAQAKDADRTADRTAD